MAGTTDPASHDSAWPNDNPVKTQLAELQAKHPGWHLWLSRDERMVGATLRDSSVGVSRTLVENTFARMEEALEQEKKAAFRPAAPHLNPLRRTF